MSRHLQTLGCALLASVALAQEPRPMQLLYADGEPSNASGEVPAAARAQVRTSLDHARSALKRTCSGGQIFSKQQFFATATGSFTRPGSRQTATLFDACHPKDQSESTLYMLDISEAGRSVQTLLLMIDDAYGKVLKTFGVRDVNLNGVSELALVWRSADGCCSVQRLDFLEFRAERAQGLGSLFIASIDRIGPNGESLDAFNYTVFVSKASAPLFVGVDTGKQAKTALLPLGKSTLRLFPLR